MHSIYNFEHLQSKSSIDSWKYSPIYYNNHDGLKFRNFYLIELIYD